MGSRVLSLQGLAPSGEKQEIWRKQKAKVLWAMKEGTEKGVNYYDTNHKKPDESPIQMGFVCYSLEKPNGSLWKVWNRVRAHHL